MKDYKSKAFHVCADFSLPKKMLLKCFLFLLYYLLSKCSTKLENIKIICAQVGFELDSMQSTSALCRQRAPEHCLYKNQLTLRRAPACRSLDSFLLTGFPVRATAVKKIKKYEKRCKRKKNQEVLIYFSLVSLSSEPQ